jgi:hypothetical protein
MNESAHQQLRLLGADLVLPVGESDAALVLWTRPVLREEARPVLRARVDLDASVPSALNRCTAGRHHLGHRRLARADDHRVPVVERDTQAVDVARVARDAAVPQIEAQQVGVRAGERGEVVRVDGEVLGVSSLRRLAKVRAAPIANGRPRDPRPA